MILPLLGLQIPSPIDPKAGTRSSTPLQAIVALIVGMALVALLSGRDIPSAIDDLNYLEYASFSTEVLLARYQDLSLAGFLLAEPLWLTFNTILGWFFDEEIVVRAIIASSVALTWVSVLKLARWNMLVALGFLVFPLVLSNYIIHLRQGLAISVFVAFWAFRPKSAMVGATIAALIHTSLLAILMLLLMHRNALVLRLLGRVSRNVLVVMWLVFLVAVPLVLQDALVFLGDRRVDDYAFRAEEAISGLGFALWAAMLTLFLLNRDQHPSDEWRFSVALLLMYLAWYFFLDIGARVLGPGLIFLCVAGNSFRGVGRWGFWLVWLSAAVVGWSLQLQRIAAYWGLGPGV